MTPVSAPTSLPGAREAGATERPRPRIAFLSYSTAEFDSRTQRIASSSIEAGYDVIVYARRLRDSALVSAGPGYHIIRVSSPWQFLVPGLRSFARKRVAAEAVAARASIAAERTSLGIAAVGERAAVKVGPRASRLPGRLRGTPLSPVFRGLKDLARRTIGKSIFMTFPGRPIAWGLALEVAVEPADIWHGMWAGSLPALQRLRRRHGGKTVYDSRDIYLHSRQFDRMNRIRRSILQRLERRWAQAADAVITVNDAYADVLARTLQVPRPPIVMNCPVRYTAPKSRPNRIREALDLPPERAVILYQGNLITERGIEQAMDAILEIPNAALVLLGYGANRDRFIADGSAPPYAGRVYVLPPVPPSELLEWTASSDVMVMAIQPTSLNHRYTTPQKLFEALAAGVPVVASDLPGMADIVRATGAGVLCDPTSPGSIAAAIREVLEQSPADLATMRERARRAAQETYNWERQVTTLFEVYGRLLGGSAR